MGFLPIGMEFLWLLGISESKHFKIFFLILLFRGFLSFSAKNSQTLLKGGGVFGSVPVSQPEKQRFEGVYLSLTVHSFYNFWGQFMECGLKNKSSTVFILF